MIARGEADGIFSGPRTDERGRIGSFPDEPLRQEKWVFFERAVDVGKRQFSSFDDLVGHQVAVPRIVPGLFEHSILARVLWKLLHERGGMVEANGAPKNPKCWPPAALTVRSRFSQRDPGSRRNGTIRKDEPLMSSGVVDGRKYICFSGTRVSPTLVGAFSRWLKQFNQTETFRALYRKCIP
jgi:hypothetical protein